MSRSRLVAAAQRLESFEASASRAKTGTGERREGGAFEAAVTDFWSALGAVAARSGASCSRVAGVRRAISYGMDGRSMVLPVGSDAELPEVGVRPSYLEVKYSVSELISAYPSTDTAIRELSPPFGPFRGSSYPEMFTGLSTNFDGTILLLQDGSLKEKILLEYKSGKSSEGRAVDGNAHERLSFQLMQYLEVATQYPSCSFLVIANGAFAKYRNKYHVNFQIQARRMECFRWFHMKYACGKVQYLEVADGLLGWLSDGTEWSSRA